MKNLSFSQYGYMLLSWLFLVSYFPGKLNCQEMLIESIVAYPGETVILNVNLQDVSNVGNATFEISYDGAQLTLMDTPRLGPLAPGALFAVNPESFPSNSGLLRFSLVQVPGITGTGTFLELQFQVAPDAEGDIPIRIRSVDMVDTNMIDIVVDTTDGNISVMAPSFIVRAFGPVDLIVTDQEGRTISKDASGIPGATYTQEDLNGDGVLDDKVVLVNASLGNHLIGVVAESGVDPSDTYTVDVIFNGEVIILAEDIQIKDIPTEAYVFLFLRHRMEADWNLISIPVELANTNMAVVLQTIDGLYNAVWGYHPSEGWERYVKGTPDFLNTLTHIVPSKGYWVHMSEAGDLILENAPMMEEPIDLQVGWNLVGFNYLTTMALEDALASIAGNYASVWGYSAAGGGWERYVVSGPSTLNDLDMFRPGKGYWIETTTPCSWDVSGDVALTPPSPFVAADSRRRRVPTTRPGIPYTIWGNVEARGTKVTDDATVLLKTGKRVQASYRLGSRDSYGGFYVLDVPVGADDSMEAKLWVQVDDTVLEASPVPPGNPGQVMRLDLSVDLRPKVSLLHQNYPNPFNPETWIPYQLKEEAQVVIKIYATTGQLVRTLNLGSKPAGFYTGKSKAAHWDGRNEVGEMVASGVYFYTIQAGEFSATKKTVVLR